MQLSILSLFFLPLVLAQTYNIRGSCRNDICSIDLNKVDPKTLCSQWTYSGSGTLEKLSRFGFQY